MTTYYIAEGRGDYTQPDFSPDDVRVIPWFRSSDLRGSCEFAWNYYDMVTDRVHDWKSYWCCVVTTTNPVDALVEMQKNEGRK